MSTTKKIKVLYIFAGQRKKTEEAWRAGMMPDTYFIGMNHMHLFDIDAEYIETSLINRLRRINFNLANIFLIFKMRQYDIIFTGASIFFIFLAKVIFRFSKPKFVYYNTSLTNLYKRSNRGFKKWMVKKTIKSLDLIVCPSVAQKDFLIKQGFDKNKICFIANGVDVDFISCHNDQKKPVEKFILSVGKDMGRDYKTLIEVVRNIDINVKIVAVPANIYDIKDIPSNVTIETLPFMDLLDLYKNCEFVVIPTKKEDYLNASDCSGQYVLLDSMASSRAVIVSKRETLKDYFVDGEDGIVVESENPAELRAAIEKLINHPSLAKEMGNRAFMRVSDNFTTKKFAERLASAFKLIVDKKA